jgi:hypothetical protein
MKVILITFFHPFNTSTGNQLMCTSTTHLDPHVQYTNLKNQTEVTIFGLFFKLVLANMDLATIWVIFFANSFGYPVLHVLTCSQDDQDSLQLEVVHFVMSEVAHVTAEHYRQQSVEISTSKNESKTLGLCHK